MTEGKRPGGLTALAVLNFVFGGSGVISVLSFAVLMAFRGAASGSGDADSHQVVEAWKEMGMGLFYAYLLVSATSSFLLIASGVGYLQQKKVLGRVLGNLYSILSILSSLAMALIVTDKAGGGFNLLTIIGLIYPVLTLILLNGTFKEDFVR